MKRLARIFLYTLLSVAFFACGKEEQPFKPGGSTGGGGTGGGGTTDPVKVEFPRKELRGVWVATVWELDWPMGAHDEASQKKKYTDYLDLFQECGINAVFFQIRSKADAYYESQYEPWSKTITGTVGKNPGYDVLKFLIDETHARGMQFHAWINPYRVETRGSASAEFPALDPKIPASMVKDYNKIRVYNPALPEVQDRIAAIVKEIITKYDVDGLHMDDYFYPSLEKGESLNDAAEYAKYGSGYSKIEDFRRANVTKAIEKIHNVIVQTRPEVIFSVSPQGNYDNNYNALFADVATWTRNGLIDVIIPQLYYSVVTFQTRIKWFVDNAFKSHLMAGYGIYNFASDASNTDFRTTSSFYSQYNYAAQIKRVEGALLYSAKSLTGNKIGITDAVKGAFGTKTLIPYLLAADEKKPDAPTGVKVDGSALTWTGAGPMFAVYKLDGTKKKATLVGTTKDKKFSLPSKGTYLVTAISELNSESDAAEQVTY